MKLLWKILKIVLCGFVTIFIVLTIIAPHLATTGKLHGNAYALHHCEFQIRTWKKVQPSDGRFDFYNLSDADKRQTISMGFRPNFWIRTNFHWAGASNREVIIVCESEFDNVSKSFWSLGQKYPAHAVGYSDGKSGLISPGEFTNLSMNSFVSLCELATNSEFNIFK